MNNAYCHSKALHVPSLPIYVAPVNVMVNDEPTERNALLSMLTVVTAKLAPSSAIANPVAGT
jgi:hypothetical protein